MQSSYPFSINHPYHNSIGIATDEWRVATLLPATNRVQMSVSPVLQSTPGRIEPLPCNQAIKLRQALNCDHFNAFTRDTSTTFRALPIKLSLVEIKGSLHSFFLLPFLLSSSSIPVPPSHFLALHPNYSTRRNHYSTQPLLRRNHYAIQPRCYSHALSSPWLSLSLSELATLAMV
jgi:hypothetical protein